MISWPLGLSIAVGALLFPRLYRRLQLSRAKHPSLGGHARMALRVSRWLPYYKYSEGEVFHVDGAPPEVAAHRQAAFLRLGRELADRAPKTLAASAELAPQIPDVAFVNAHRVPFQFRELAQKHLRVGSVASATRGAEVCDLDGNWSYDLTGSYGVNLLGNDAYKAMLATATHAAEALGPILGLYHESIAENVTRLRQISGLDEVSFHMSGTEAVMQAVRLARYHTRRSHIVRFTGAYHGWWDGVQAGVGNPRPAHEVYTLRDMHDATLAVLEGRRDIACVLINPLQAMTLNAAAAADSTLLGTGRSAHFDKAAYAAWLVKLRDVCTRRCIVLIFDEVFLGFRLAYGGAQEYFGVKADLVTYGKTLGGGLPVGAVCGTHALMKRWREDSPADICFARGTFNSHPYVMTAMRAFLRHMDTPEGRSVYADVDGLWNGRAADLNARLEQIGVPVRIVNLTSVWTTLYTQPGRYHWMLQFYLRKHGLTVPWTGTGRYIFPHTLTEDDWQQIAARFVAATQEMAADGWWWRDAALTKQSIQRQLARETLRAILRKA